MIDYTEEQIIYIQKDIIQSGYTHLWIISIVGDDEFVRRKYSCKEDDLCTFAKQLFHKTLLLRINDFRYKDSVREIFLYWKQIYDI